MDGNFRTENSARKWYSLVCGKVETPFSLILFPHEGTSIRARFLAWYCLCLCLCVCAHMCSVQLSKSFAISWTVAHQPPLSMWFPRQEYWVGSHFLLQSIFPTQRSNPGFDPALQADSLLTDLPGKTWPNTLAFTIQMSHKFEQTQRSLGILKPLFVFCFILISIKSDSLISVSWTQCLYSTILFVSSHSLVWLCRVLVAACGALDASGGSFLVVHGLCCGMWA